MCWKEREGTTNFENLDLMMRNSRPAFACKLSAVQFYKLLGQEGFLVTSKDLYQSCLLQDIIHVLISAALWGMCYELANRQQCFGSLRVSVSTLVKHPLSALHCEWVSVAPTQQQGRGGGRGDVSWWSQQCPSTLPAVNSSIAAALRWTAEMIGEHVYRLC